MKRKLKILVVFMVLILVGVLLFKVLKINRINCISQFGPCSTKLEEKLKSYQGKFYFVTKNELNNLLSKESVSSYTIRLALPNTVNVYVNEKKAYFASQFEGDNKFFYLSEDGTLLSVNSSTSLPTIIMKAKPIEYKVGDNLPEEVVFSGRILTKLSQAYDIKIAHLEADRLLVTLPDGILVYFPQSGDADVLLGALTLILYRLPTGEIHSRIGRDVKIIDLRFKNPVVK